MNTSLEIMKSSFPLSWVGMHTITDSNRRSNSGELETVVVSIQWSVKQEKKSEIEEVEYLMGRSRYKIHEPTYPHFVTCTVLHWIPIFTRSETTEMIFDSLKYLQRNDNLKLYAYVILENHLHMIVQSDDLSKNMESFKKYTARRIIDLLKARNVRSAGFL